MYCQNLKYISSLKGLKPADLARKAGVSRAAVSRWFREGEKTGFVNAETKTLCYLSQNINVPPQFFFEDMPDLKPESTLFLWDHLYPDMTAFVCALIKGDREAVARLVQVLGLYESEMILGKKIILDFQAYRKYLHPARVRQLEAVWHLYR